jgi:phosphoribosylaminoimidazole-succinocarboxamide synthase
MFKVVGMFPIERKVRPYIVGRLMKKYGRIYIHIKQTLVHIRNTGMFKDHCFFP